MMMSKDCSRKNTQPLDGVIKFHCTLIEADSIQPEDVAAMNTFRSRLHDLHFIGTYPDGIGFGNVSQRFSDGGEFIISGTQTGGPRNLDAAQYTRVIAYNIAHNSLTCKGRIKASSESLTHAAVYECDPEIQVVAHIHNLPLWTRLLHRLPTTREDIPYGTPAMAFEIKRCIAQAPTQSSGIVVMAGHKEGLIYFGKDFASLGRLFAASTQEEFQP